MGRPRKPTTLLEVTGAFKKDPQRRRTGEPKPRLGIGSAPVSFSTDFATVWDELVDNICPGVLGNSDRMWLEITARLLCQFRTDPRGMTGGMVALLLKSLAHLGMNPTDRSRVTATEPDGGARREDSYF